MPHARDDGIAGQGIKRRSNATTTGMKGMDGVGGYQVNGGSIRMGTGQVSQMDDKSSNI